MKTRKIEQRVVVMKSTPEEYQEAFNAVMLELSRDHDEIQVKDIEPLCSYVYYYLTRSEPEDAGDAYRLRYGRGLTCGECPHLVRITKDRRTKWAECGRTGEMVTFRDHACPERYEEVLADDTERI